MRHQGLTEHLQKGRMTLRSWEITELIPPQTPLPLHNDVKLHARDEICDTRSAFSRRTLTPTSGEQQAEERYGRVVFIILLHSLRTFLISQTVKTRCLWRPNSQIQRRFMLQSQGFNSNFRRWIKQTGGVPG